MLGPNLKIRAALVAPALQFDQAVALPGGMTLGERQPTCFGKQIHQQDRLVVDLELMSAGKVLKKAMPDIGPRRLNGKIVVNLARHWSSGRSNPSKLKGITTD